MYQSSHVYTESAEYTKSASAFAEYTKPIVKMLRYYVTHFINEIYRYYGTFENIHFTLGSRKFLCKRPTAIIVNTAWLVQVVGMAPSSSY